MIAGTVTSVYILISDCGLVEAEKDVHTCTVCSYILRVNVYLFFYKFPLPISLIVRFLKLVKNFMSKLNQA